MLQTAVLVATPAALAEVLSPPQPQDVLGAARYLVIDEVDACLAVRSTCRFDLDLRPTFCCSAAVRKVSAGCLIIYRPFHTTVDPCQLLSWTMTFTLTLTPILLVSTCHSMRRLQRRRGHAIHQIEPVLL